VISQNNWHPVRGKSAFSLIEMVSVIALLVMLIVAGVSLLHGTASQSRRAATDLLAGMIEQARTAALTSRSCVALAVAEPGDLPAGDERCRVALFKVQSWPDSPTDPLQGVLIGRWRTLGSGIVLLGGAVRDLPNPLDGTKLTISYGTAKPMTAQVHVIAFNACGGIHYPVGSMPVAMRIAEGAYRGGKAHPNRLGGPGPSTESRLKIGRVTSRSYRIDG
jgi:type II secretory pathway pseudopilin PulG